MADLKKVDIPFLREAINVAYGYEYYENDRFLKRNLIRNLATFIFDNSDCYMIKKHLPHDVYVKVLEAYANGDHDT
jgi:hypothetical protein